MGEAFPFPKPEMELSILLSVFIYLLITLGPPQHQHPQPPLAITTAKDFKCFAREGIYMNHVIFKVEFKKINRSLKIKGRERLNQKTDSEISYYI